MNDCSLGEGQYAVLLNDRNLRVSKQTHPVLGCELSTGSVIRIYSNLPTEKEADVLVLQKPKKKESLVMEDKKDTVGVEDLEAEETQTVSEVLIPSEVEQAVATANQLGGDYAAIVAIVLAGIAVLGGKKAWSFYSQKAEQKHELELKKLELEKKSSNSDGQSPPACQAVHAKLETEVTAMKQKVGLMEKRMLMIDEFDPEDLERKVKKLTKSVKSIKDELDK